MVGPRVFVAMRGQKKGIVLKATNKQVGGSHYKDINISLWILLTTITWERINTMLLSIYVDTRLRAEKKI